MYAQNAIAVNEFLGHSWNKVMQCLLHQLKPDNLSLDLDNSEAT